MKKRTILLVLTFSLIITGGWFSTSNAYKFLKGYLLYKTNAASKASVQEVTPEVKGTASKKGLYLSRPKIGQDIGVLTIPKINASLPIIHGTDEDELEKGVGHFAGSVLPGEDDNSVLSGHRDTVFRKLGAVGVGDILIVKTSAGEFKYKVKKVRIVDENDRTVIVPKPKATLTVSTCYPFDYIGSAPERYVLVADLIH